MTIFTVRYGREDGGSTKEQDLRVSRTSWNWLHMSLQVEKDTMGISRVTKLCSGKMYKGIWH